MNMSNLRQGQPPLSFFDKSFHDNPSDVLYCSLNEIEPVFLENESLLDNEFIQLQVVDPRSKLPVTQSIFDYTVSWKPDLFDSANRSLLTKKEHSTCVGYLQSLKSKKQIFPHQLQCYTDTTTRRQNEKIAFLQFLLQYNNANYEKIYAPGLMLVELYQKLYKWEAERLIKENRDGIFQIHTGFPIPRLCGNSDVHGAVTDVEVVSTIGSPCLMDLTVDLSKIRTRIEAYLELNAPEKTENKRELASGKQTQFEISTEALVFLLCAGEYIDIPAEVLVEVVANHDGECVIHVNEPLPSRNAGVHTGELVAIKCTEVFLQRRQQEVVEVIQATEFNGTYSLQTVESFMSTRKSYTNPPVKSSSLVKWNLNLENGDKQISILTRTNLAFKDGQGNGHICPSLKLEYKPQFGCEVSTKVSLIREWIEQRLCTLPHSSTDRHRINASTFKTILHENLSLDDIEKDLERHYNVKVSRLLGSLADFLGLLTNVSPGRYLLQYNPRFQEKLMLYSETKQATSKTCVTLHGLLQERPSDMTFMTSRQLTPIDDALCSAMHDFYHLLPCAFPPWRTKVTHKIIDDRQFILRKVQEKTNVIAAKKTRFAERRKKVKRQKRAQKMKLNTQRKLEEKKDTMELEEDINHDRLLFGFEAMESD